MQQGDWLNLSQHPYDLDYDKVSYHTLSTRKVRESAIVYALKYGSARCVFNVLETLYANGENFHYSMKERKSLFKDLLFADRFVASQMK